MQLIPVSYPHSSKARWLGLNTRRVLAYDLQSVRTSNEPARIEYKIQILALTADDTRIIAMDVNHRFQPTFANAMTTSFSVIHSSSLRYVSF